jgi:hypothetical protein
MCAGGCSRKAAEWLYSLVAGMVIVVAFDGIRHFIVTRMGYNAASDP